MKKKKMIRSYGRQSKSSSIVIKRLSIRTLLITRKQTWIEKTNKHMKTSTKKNLHTKDKDSSTDGFNPMIRRRMVPVGKASLTRACHLVSSHSQSSRTIHRATMKNTSSQSGNHLGKVVLNKKNRKLRNNAIQNIALTTLKFNLRTTKWTLIRKTRESTAIKIVVSSKIAMETSDCSILQHSLNVTVGWRTTFLKVGFNKTISMQLKGWCTVSPPSTSRG